MSGNHGKKSRAHFARKADSIQSRQARSLDALAEFDKFSEHILPKLKRAVLENWTPERMRKEFAPLMQAIMIKKGAEGSYNALKDTLDRYEGTAVQRVEQKTVYKKMDQQELAALALQKLKDSGLVAIDGKVIRTVPNEADDEKSDS